MQLQKVLRHAPLLSSAAHRNGCCAGPGARSLQDSVRQALKLHRLWDASMSWKRFASVQQQVPSSAQHGNPTCSYGQGAQDCDMSRTIVPLGRPFILCSYHTLQPFAHAWPRTLAAPRCCAAMTASWPTGPSPTTATTLPAPTPPAQPSIHARALLSALNTSWIRDNCRRRLMPEHVHVSGSVAMDMTIGPDNWS